MLHCKFSSLRNIRSEFILRQDNYELNMSFMNLAELRMLAIKFCLFSLALR